MHGGGAESSFDQALAESQGAANAELQAVDDADAPPEERRQSLVVRVFRCGSGAFPADLAELEPKQRKDNKPQGWPA